MGGRRFSGPGGGGAAEVLGAIVGQVASTAERWITPS